MSLPRFGAAFASLLIVAVSAGAQEQPEAPEGMQYPLAAAVAEDGTIYVADRNLPGIWKITDGQPEIYFQGSKKFRTPLNAVRCVAMDEKGRLLAGDSSTREVYRFNDKHEPVPLTKGENAGIGIPMAIAVADDGTIYVADLEIHRIVKVPSEGGRAEIVAEVAAPRGLTLDEQGNLVVLSHGENHLVRVSPDGKTIEPIVTGRPFDFGHNVVPGPEGTFYATDGYAKAVWKIDAEGKATKLVSGEPLKNPVGLARRGEDLVVVDPHVKAVFALDRDGKLTPIAGVSP